MASMDEAGMIPIAPARELGGGGPGETAQGFEWFFETHHASLFRALWLVTRNRHEAEEVMQDAFLRLWERWDRVSGLADPTGYLYRTAMNVLRSRARRARVALRRATGHLPPDEGLRTVEDRDALVRALAPLTPRQRAALVLTEYVGLTSEEAGEALGIRGSTVRVLTSRARAVLEKELGDRDA